MNRTDRLYAIAEELRYAGPSGRTSASLAEQFEVTARTIKRDVSALQQAGLPIWGEGRPGGGYRMMASSATLPPVNFTTGEAAAVAVALAAQPDMPFAAEGTTALTKLLGAMAPEGREAVNVLLQRVWTRGTPGRGHPARVLDEAIRLDRVAAITYADGRGAVTRRHVEPLAFARTGQRWYLMAYCRLRRDGRWFRLDRIRDASLTGEPAPVRDLDALFGDAPPDARPVSAGTGRPVTRTPSGSPPGP